VVRELLLTLSILGIVRGKVIIEDFYILFCVFYKELCKCSFIYSVLGKTLL
jgi:hypothetical protein